MILFLLHVSHAPLKNLIPPPALAIRTLNEQQYAKELAKALDLSEPELQIVDSISTEPTQSPPQKNFFLSRDNQQVDHPTRAAKIGRFKNVPLEKLLRTTEEEPQVELERPPQLDLNSPKAQTKIAHSGRVYHAPKLQRSPASAEESSSEDYLKDIAIGGQTLLNTQEYKFFSFYERIRERLTSQWRVRLEQEIPRLANAGNSIESDRVTMLRVFMDIHGDIVKHEILGSSGLVELDQAAIEAFYFSAPFNHPPRQMINADGLLSIRWDFVVLAIPGTSNFRMQVRRVQ